MTYAPSKKIVDSTDISAERPLPDEVDSPAKKLERWLPVHEAIDTLSTSRNVRELRAASRDMISSLRSYYRPTSPDYDLGTRYGGSDYPRPVILDSWKGRFQEQVERQVERLRSLDGLETVEGEESPTAGTVNTALRIVMGLSRSFDLVPDMINPTYEGSLTLEFIRGDRYDLIEIYNDCSIIYLKREGDGSVDVHQVEEGSLEDSVWPQIADVR